jgi:hypothetical protein
VLAKLAFLSPIASELLVSFVRLFVDVQPITYRDTVRTPFFANGRG